MAVTSRERQSFGWLGRIPPEIVNGPREVSAKYKKLAHRARIVANMPNTPAKVRKAKAIERQYYDLVERASRHV